MKTVRIAETIISQQKLFQPVVPFRPGKDRLLPLDLTDANTELTDELLGNMASFSNYITKALGHAGAKYGIGGYAEHRTVYRFSRVFDAPGGADEPRRLHLGIDIWGKPHTPVMAPLEGIVHSFAFNNQPGDYGATIILTHHLAGISFHTLYGHLSLNSLKNMLEGTRIEAGEMFADFGIPAENGGWPPHLHFQVILDMGDQKGDYPGVCKYSEKDKWIANSPDPDIILQMKRYISQ